MTLNQLTHENTHNDDLGHVSDPIWIPWRDPRKDASTDPFHARRTSGNNLQDPKSYMTEEWARRYTK